jgi:hypothetical protein
MTPRARAGLGEQFKSVRAWSGQTRACVARFGSSVRRQIFRPTVLRTFGLDGQDL